MSHAPSTGSAFSAIPSGGLYKCEQCANQFPADGVWNNSGSIICKACYSAAVAASNQSLKASGRAHPSPSVSTHLSSAKQHSGTLLSHITCPHCWQRITADQILWVSQHAELMGDAVLGSDAASRFLPTRFTVEGDALDARGMKCQLLGCPRCHLILPRPMTDTEALFISIVGVPASGKSYFLTAMTWELRRMLAEKCAVIFSDTDTVANRILNEYEEHLFLQSDQSRMVAIRKTEVHGFALYDQIRLGQHIVSLPRPFLFTLRPGTGHPNFLQTRKFSRILCLYDNAGEAFEPGEDTSASPVTQHLAKSKVLMFVFDPIQDARFRLKCKQVSNDPQLEGRARRQETVFIEMATRIRRYTGLAAHKKHDGPMVIIVPKADVWGSLIDLDINTEPFVKSSDIGTVAGVDLDRIRATSAKVRSLLAESAPEFVSAVEEFCQHVVYIPVSALGGSPSLKEGEGGFVVRAGSISPKWVAVPILFSFAAWATGLISGISKTSHGNPTLRPVAGAKSN
jgi:hypothetical protein